MKLLILSGEFPPFRGGIATYSRELAEGAVELGFDVTVAAPAYGYETIDKDNSYPFRVLRFPGGENTAMAIFAKIFWLRRLAGVESFDIVHAADWPFYLPIALSSYRRHSRCLFTVHGTEINMMRRKTRALILEAVRFWTGWILAIANSSFTATYLLQRFPQQRADRLRVIPLGVRPPATLGTVQRGTARDALNLTESDFVVLTLGRLVYRKGHHILVEALKRLADDLRCSVVWYIVGPEIDTEYAEKIKAAIAKTDVRAVFTGALPSDELERAFVAADVFCVPSVIGPKGEFEGFGLVYVEAGLRGLPSIATRVGGIPDAVIDGETGLLVEQQDPTALADAISKLWADPDLRARLGHAARVRAQTMTWTSVAARTYSTSVLADNGTTSAPLPPRNDTLCLKRLRCCRK